MRSVFVLVLCVLILGCQQSETINKLEIGFYRATLALQDNEVLPFNFQVTSDSTLVVFNAEERIEVDEITYKNDSVFIQFPVFEGYVAAAFEGKNLEGDFIKESVGRVVPFLAEFGNEQRFLTENEAKFNVEGIWEVVFSEGIEGDEYIAKGIFKQIGNQVTGTFRTKTGDYRFLEGVVDGTRLKLSAFDASHAFYFTANLNDSSMNGYFYSGNHFKEPFRAKRNPNFDLPDSNKLTVLNDGYETLEFSFPDETGELVSLTDAQFKNKVVIVQVMGTWCPNCLDESKYYTQFYNQHKSDDLAFVALAFEYDKTPEKAFGKIKRLKERLQINYPVVLAQYGGIDKVEAQQKLPMLNHVLSYPTSIFIDKQGKVRKIHTGFNGPATGDKFVEFKKEFEGFVAALLAE